MENSEFLIPLFFMIATLYAMVGFGGGSSYIALLAIFGMNHLLIPKVALICNLIVVSGGAYHFIKNKQLPWKLVTPFLITSIPLAYYGGSIPISKEFYQGILGVLLFIISINLLFFHKISLPKKQGQQKLIYSLLIGGLIGFISGLVGIGGGIFLSPILHLLNWARPKQIASFSTAFIFVNSLAGLAGQFQKTSFDFNHSAFFYLFITVFIGGQLGSRICQFRLSQKSIKKATAVLVLFVSTRLIFNLL